MTNIIANHSLKLENFLAGEFLESLDSNNLKDIQIWADHDLAILVENRCGVSVDPNGWSDDQRRYWRGRCLLPTESFLGPEVWGRYKHFWIRVSRHRSGVIAVRLPISGRSRMFVGSLYILPQFRGLGLGEKVLALVEKKAVRCGFWGIELETDWRWRKAVQFYLKHGFWLDNWKENLILIRDHGLPNYQFLIKNNLASFQLGPPFNTVVFQAERRRSHSDYSEQPLSHKADWHSLRQMSLNTFGLFLALSGWPLNRGFLSRFASNSVKKRLAPEALMQYINSRDKRQLGLF